MQKLRISVILHTKTQPRTQDAQAETRRSSHGNRLEQIVNELACVAAGARGDKCLAVLAGVAQAGVGRLRQAAPVVYLC